MKTELTIEESQHLIELGVDPKLASGTKMEDKTDLNDPNSFLDIIDHPVFRLEDVIEALPKEIDSKIKMFLSFYWTPKDRWTAHYDCIFASTKLFKAPELIDALYSLLCWAITNGHYKPKTDNQ